MPFRPRHLWEHCPRHVTLLAASVRRAADVTPHNSSTTATAPARPHGEIDGGRPPNLAAAVPWGTEPVRSPEAIRRTGRARSGGPGGVGPLRPTPAWSSNEPGGGRGDGESACRRGSVHRGGVTSGNASDQRR